MALLYRYGRLFEVRVNMDALVDTVRTGSGAVVWPSARVTPGGDG
jgi:hypothetical protein